LRHSTIGHQNDTKDSAGHWNQPARGEPSQPAAKQRPRGERSAGVLLVTATLAGLSYVWREIPPAMERAMMSALAISVTALRRLQFWNESQKLFTVWWRRIRSRYELERLNERDLADMGLMRPDIFNEIQKPFWQE
jgi:uncharacterized protein YjiS (DUF1127 family)